MLFIRQPRAEADKDIVLNMSIFYCFFLMLRIAVLGYHISILGKHLNNCLHFMEWNIYDISINPTFHGLQFYLPIMGWFLLKSTSNPKSRYILGCEVKKKIFFQRVSQKN